MCGIYLITNTVTGKHYVGQSINIATRWVAHKSRAFSSTAECYNSPLSRSMRKYGTDAFTMTVLCECDAEELNMKEAEYIALYNSITPNGYNILPYADKKVECVCCVECGKAIPLNYTSGLCRECVRMRSRQVERPSKEELFQLLKKSSFAAVARDFGVTDNAVRKWCDSYGLSRHSADYKEKKPKNSSRRAVRQLDPMTGEVLNTFESTNAAARALGHNKGSHITEACQGKHKTAYGYVWQYLNDNE